MADDRTEKATPKKRAEARKKGQVARSVDANGAAVLLAALLALSAFGPYMLHQIEEATYAVMALMTVPAVVDRQGIDDVLVAVAQPTVLACAPVAFVCLVAGVVASVGQVGFTPSPGALKPELRKLNPLTGAKNLFGPHALFETVKNIAKVGVVGAIAALAVFPKLDELAALVGMPPAALVGHLASTVLEVAQRAALAYLVIAAIDYGYQRWRHEKGLLMD